MFINYRAVSWWYFLATACALTAGLAGVGAGFLAAIGITLAHLLHFALRERSLITFPVQVRWGVLLVLVLGLLEPLRWIYWVPAVGIWVQCLFGYCLLARVVTLMPWNRQERFSAGLIRKVFFSPPVTGTALEILGGPSDSSSAKHAG